MSPVSRCLVAWYFLVEHRVEQCLKHIFECSVPFVISVGNLQDTVPAGTRPC
jgi:hypothetical protein